MNTVKSFRMDEELFEKARRVAEINNTTVPALVRLFLSNLRVQYDPVKTAKSVATSISGKNEPPKVAEIGFAIIQERKEAARRGECQHPTFKTIPYGTFCRECGVKLS